MNNLPAESQGVEWHAVVCYGPPEWCHKSYDNADSRGLDSEDIKLKFALRPFQTIIAVLLGRRTCTWEKAKG